MYRDHTVGVVVPAYDEEDFVGEVIRTVPEFVDRIYPVDDASTDETWDEIQAAARRVNAESEGGETGRETRTGTATATGNAVPDGAGAFRPPDREGRDGREDPGDPEDPEDPDDFDDFEGWEDREPEAEERSSAFGSANQCRVVPLRHDENRGVGAAIKTGYRKAREDGMDAVAVMAGDAQMDPDQLPRLLDPVVSGRAAYSKGNRLAVDEYREEMSRWRQFGNALLTVLTRISSGYWSMMDPQNGYTVITAEALDDLDLDAVFDDYGFANALLVHLNVAGSRVADVPMPAKYGDEESGIRYSTFVPQLSALLAKGFAWRLTEKHVRQEFHPLALLYGLGVAGTLVGLLGTVRGLLSGGTRHGEESETKLRNDDDDDDDESHSARDERVYRGERTGQGGQAGQGGRTGRSERTGQGARTRRAGPMTAVAGLVTTGLAMVLDANHSEDLHVTVDADEGSDLDSSGGEPPSRTADSSEVEP